MSEPPVHASTEGVHAKPHATSNRWVDYSIAFSAILISLISLVIAIQHGRVQERLVAANSWPFLTYGVDNSMTDRGQNMSFLIRNAGVGPAVLKSLEVRYRDKPVRGWAELLQVCCDVARDLPVQQFLALGVTGDDHPVGIIPAKEHSLMLRFTHKPENTALWDKLSEARLHLSFKACYCSIIDECWKSDLQTLNPERVERCEAGPNDYIELGAGLDNPEKFPIMSPLSAQH